MKAKRAERIEHRAKTIGRLKRQGSGVQQCASRIIALSNDCVHFGVSTENGGLQRICTSVSKAPFAFCEGIEGRVSKPDGSRLIKPIHVRLVYPVYDVNGVPKFLFHRTKTGDVVSQTWKLPGGIKDINEDSHKAMRMEISQELGAYIPEPIPLGPFHSGDVAIHFYTGELIDPPREGRASVGRSDPGQFREETYEIKYLSAPEILRLATQGKIHYETLEFLRRWHEHDNFEIRRKKREKIPSDLRASIAADTGIEISNVCDVLFRTRTMTAGPFEGNSEMSILVLTNSFWYREAPIYCGKSDGVVKKKADEYVSGGTLQQVLSGPLVYPYMLRI
ncbi:MAG: hypothetical protein ACE5DM_01900 [Candidatus Nanoarchaeia archaeon]